MKSEADVDRMAALELFDELRLSAPLEILVEMSLDGVPRVGSGYADGEACVIKFVRPDGDEPDVLLFPTYLFVHWLARYFELGPRPVAIEDGALGIPREVLDDPDRRSAKLTELPKQVRDALGRPDALRWSVTLVDRATGGEDFRSSVEVFDAHGGGIWLLTQVPGEDGEGLVVVEPTTSATVWALLTDLLPDDESWATITGAPDPQPA